MEHYSAIVRLVQTMIERFGLWKPTVAAIALGVGWRLPDLIAAVRWW